MVLIIPSVVHCVLCGQQVHKHDKAIGFPAFLPQGHRFHKFADAVFHQKCFEDWTDRPEFEQVYQEYLSIWASKPKNLTSLQEMEEWSKKAFKNL